MGSIIKNGINYTGGSGASSYNELSDKPSINGVALSGNKTSSDLGIITKSVDDLENYYTKSQVDDLEVADLSDVDITTPSNNDVLKYNATSGKWENGTGGGGGGSYTAGNGIDITNDVISTKQSEEGDIDEIIDVYPTAGNLVSIVNAFNRGDIYSTDEKMIGQWIDGKPLYAKTINTGALSNAPNKKVAHSISNLGEIVSMLAIYHRTDGKWFQISNVHLTAANKTLQLSITTTNVEIESNSGDYSDVDKSYVTLQYTKTTDTAISIGEATEYSTEEKIIGTWIDGKPVWQKTFITTLSKSGNFYRSDTDVSGLAINDVIEITGIVKGVDSGHTFHVSNGSSFSGDTANAVSYYIYDNTLTCLTNSSSYNGGSTRITIQYTKTV